MQKIFYLCNAIVDKKDCYYVQYLVSVGRKAHKGLRMCYIFATLQSEGLFGK